jgi:hypothetical protein
MHAVTCRVSLSSFYVHHSGVLFVFGWRRRVDCVDCFLVHARTHLLSTHTHKKNLLELGRRNKEVVTYGIRASSTRDLGFITTFVDMIGLVILFMIEFIVRAKVIMDRQRRGG